jgi:hypothetical protein
VHLWLPSCILIPSRILFLQLLSQGIFDFPVLQAEVTRASDADTSAQEVAAVQDSITLHVKDAEDWATLVEREEPERVSRMEAENDAQAFAHEVAEVLVQKIAHLEGELEEERYHTPVLRRRNQSLYTCAQDVQITRIVTIW